ncbi:hypothetical protein D3C78_1834420 [compost metagenome]
MARRIGRVMVWSPPRVRGMTLCSRILWYDSSMIRTASSRLKVLIATSPMSATASESNGAAPVAML